MNFFMVSQCGEGAHTLHVIQQEGNTVQLYVDHEAYKNIWDGLVPKAKKIDPPEGSIVIFDATGMGPVADKLKKSGFLVVGSSKWADKMEHDRQFGFEAMESSGIKVPLTAEFTNFSDVEEFLNENGEDEDGEERRFVFKASGKNLPNYLTYCSKDRGDLEEWLKHVESHYSKFIKSFILQEFVEGVAVSSELWCDGTKFVRPANHTVELKAFMNDELGPATGCSGNLVWIEEEMCRIVAAGVAKIEKAAVAAGYVGPIDLNSIVNREGVWGLEWTPRFGYDAWPTLMFLLNDGVGKFFADLSAGQLSRMPLADKFAAGVRLSIPPYPLDPEKTQDVQKVHPNSGIPIRGLDDKNAGSFYFYEVMDADGALQHSEGIGSIGVAIGVANDPQHAFHKVYHALDEIVIPEKQYRTDMAEKLCEMHHEVEHQDNVSIGYIGSAVEVEDGS